jgi:hypothetical protein
MEFELLQWEERHNNKNLSLILQFSAQNHILQPGICQDHIILCSNSL